MSLATEKIVQYSLDHSVLLPENNAADYTSFLASKKLLRCLICQNPVRRRTRVWAIDHHNTLWFVLSLVCRNRSSRYCEQTGIT